jgi:hypothetical protein
VGADETLPAKQRQCVLDTWLRIVKAQPRVMKPTAGLDEKGNFYFGWNPGDRSLDIEIDQDGKLDWFFVNHATGKGAEGSSTTKAGYLEFLPVASAGEPYQLTVQYERRLLQYISENDRLKTQVTELQARMTRMVEEHRVALASNAKPVASESQGNAINHPAHYNTGKIEVIVAIEDWKLGFNLGNTVKYVARAGKKNPNAVLEDLRKAHWYLEREIEGLEQR